MTLYRATADGNIPMTQEEEAAIRAQWAENERFLSVPKTVTMRQARLALESEDLLDRVDTLVANAKKSVQINWEFAETVYRHDELVVSIGNTLGLTEKQVNDLFIKAKSL